MKKRLENTIKRLKYQLNQHKVDPGTVEVMIGQVEAYMDFTERYMEDLELQEIGQMVAHQETINNINEVLKDFGIRWKTSALN